MNPKISVIVPVYNAEKYLEQCIESILNQTYRNLEVVLINDGSTDESGDICDGYAKEDNRVRVLHIENGGVSNARNKGIEISTGDYIAFVDADDWIDKNMYLEMLEIIIEKNADIVMCSYAIFDGKVEHSVNYPWPDNTIFEHEDIAKKLIPAFLAPIDLNHKEQKLIMGSVWKCLFNQELIKNKNIIFDAKIPFTEDLVFLLYTFSYAKKVAIIDKSFYKYRVDAKNKFSTTQNYIKNAYLGLKRSQEHIIKIVGQIKYPINLQKQIEWRNINNVISSIANISKCPEHSFKEKVSEAKFYVEDSNINNSISIVGYTFFRPSHKIIIFLIKNNLIAFAMFIYLLKNKIN